MNQVDVISLRMYIYVYELSELRMESAIQCIRITTAYYHKKVARLEFSLYG